MRTLASETQTHVFSYGQGYQYGQNQKKTKYRTPLGYQYGQNQKKTKYRTPLVFYPPPPPAAEVGRCHRRLYINPVILCCVRSSLPAVNHVWVLWGPSVSEGWVKRVGTFAKHSERTHLVTDDLLRYILCSWPTADDENQTRHQHIKLVTFLGFTCCEPHAPFLSALLLLFAGCTAVVRSYSACPSAAALCAYYAPFLLTAPTLRDLLSSLRPIPCTPRNRTRAHTHTDTNRPSTSRPPPLRACESARQPSAPAPRLSAGAPHCRHFPKR